MINQIVVLAGGLATRLYPITDKIPKSMVEVAGKPFLSHQIEIFKQNGIKEIVMCVGHFSDQIKDYYGDGKNFGIRIIYSQENEKLDTGGAIKNALPYLDDYFFVIYGDSYLLCDYQKVFERFNRSGALGLMTVYENNNEIEPSRILLDNEYIKKYRKDPPPRGAKFAEYGLNILPKSIIGIPSESSFPISEYFDILSNKKQLLAYDVKQRFYEIGCPEGLELLNSLLSDQSSDQLFQSPEGETAGA